MTDPKTLFIAFIYRNFMAKPDQCGNPKSHIGLGISSLHAAKVLREQGIPTHVYGVWVVADIVKILTQNTAITHIIIQAPWIPAVDIAMLTQKFPDVKFIVICHSQIGFLQVEAGAVKLIRDYLLLQDEILGFQFAANSQRFSNFIINTYNTNCIHLPNLYDIGKVNRKTRRNDNTLIRIGSFGAIRLLKNHATAAAAGLLIAERLGVDLEFWVSTQREEHGKGVLQMIRNMFANLQWATLVENPWQSWAQFRQTVRHMDLCMQLSATETFNIVTADAVAEGVPSVVSDAIEWTPRSWEACIDDAEEIASIGCQLLTDPFAPREGLKHLKKYLRTSVQEWLDFLDVPRQLNQNIPIYLQTGDE